MKSPASAIAKEALSYRQDCRSILNMICNQPRGGERSPASHQAFTKCNSNSLTRSKLWTINTL